MPADAEIVLAEFDSADFMLIGDGLKGCVEAWASQRSERPPVGIEAQIEYLIDICGVPNDRVARELRQLREREMSRRMLALGIDPRI